MVIPNGISVLLAGETCNSIRTFDELSFSEIFFCVYLIATCIRFYHGNIKNASIEHELYEVGDSGGGWLLTDIIILFIQTLLLAVMSFYINNHNHFLHIFLVVLLIGATWSFIKYMYLKRKVVNRVNEEEMKFSPLLFLRWAISDYILIVILIVWARNTDRGLLWMGNAVGWLLYFLLSAHFIFDYISNWSYYSPIPDKKATNAPESYENNESKNKKYHSVMGPDEYE